MQRRTHEIGVRISLGADKRNIAILAMRGTTITVIVGLVAGVAISRALSHLVASELYGVTANDPFVVVAACATLAIAAFLAALLPAWRATNISPLEALRCE
jgi:ABC-type antimicrobial peptide transport system permease subunit